MPTVTVYDIRLVPRETEVPLTCPHCDADLTEAGAIDEWQYADERWSSRLAKPDENLAELSCWEGDEGNGTIVDYQGGSDSGHGDTEHIGPVMLFCSSCHATLASGSTRVEEAPAPTSGKGDNSCPSS